MPLVIVRQDMVTGTDIMAAAFRSAIEGKRYLEFRYVCQKRYKDTPSRIAAMADTVYIEQPDGQFDMVKGYLEDDAVFFAKTTGHWCIRVYTMNRRVRGEADYYSDKHNRRTGNNFKQGEYLPRTYRLVGIERETVLVGAGRRGKIRLFPDYYPEPQFDGLWNELGPR